MLSDDAEFTYKCTEFYHGEDESGIIWNDPNIGIDWSPDGIDEIILSDKTGDKFQESKNQVLNLHTTYPDLLTKNQNQQKITYITNYNINT